MKVYVEGRAGSYENMWADNGHEVVLALSEADIVQFIGGADVDPALYHKESHPRTHSSIATDELSIGLYSHCIKYDIPMVGVCRGGQVLNVLNGGEMWQHVNNHAIGGTHVARDLVTQRYINVSSTHHQMMIPGNGSVTVAIGEKLSSWRETTDDLGDILREEGDHEDVEVVWYPKGKSLCFQPHPEFFTPDHECQKYYFELLERYLEVK